MTREFRLTRRAETSLESIIGWTDDTFGPDQARRYVAELLARCAEIAAGTAHVRDCSMLADGIDAGALHFARAGAHYVIFEAGPEEIRIIDFVHARRNLPQIVAGLGPRKQ